MGTIFVQFADAAGTSVNGVFAGPQDATAYPNQGEVADDDARYLAFMTPVSELPASIIAATRWSHQVAGVTVDGLTVDSDSETLGLLTGAAFDAYQDSTLTIDWKLADNSYTTLTAAQVTAISKAVSTYVRACFSREKDLLAALAGGTYTADMLDTGWPDNGSTTTAATDTSTTATTGTTTGASA